MCYSAGQSLLLIVVPLKKNALTTAICAPDLTLVSLETAQLLCCCHKQDSLSLIQTLCPNRPSARSCRKRWIQLLVSLMTVILLVRTFIQPSFLASPCPPISPGLCVSSYLTSLCHPLYLSLLCYLFIYLFLTASLAVAWTFMGEHKS